MNALGAKIIKAEMLGNDTLAAKLKKKLEAARETAGRAREGGGGEEEGQREETVVLTRTDAKGMTRPVHATAEEAAPTSSRRYISVYSPLLRYSSSSQKSFSDTFVKSSASLWAVTVVALLHSWITRMSYFYANKG